ncbi:MAG: DUF1343 domain-containing protein [Ignavibacteriae bacterium]|nr:DUF1343 domain-containing protein [Ignavibacteriota bacterium]
MNTSAFVLKIRNLFILILTYLLVIPIYSQFTSYTSVKTGLDVLIEKNFEPLKGKKVALLTNFAGRTRDGKSSVDVFQNTNVCSLIKIFTPEHGFYTTVPAGESVSDDKIADIPVISLYGSKRKPLASDFNNCDAIVVDLQDIGIRSYTYISTVFKMMEACAENNKQLIILDRPNPLGGLIVDGNVLEKGKESFIGIIPVTYIHGCTLGELANMINNEGWLTTDSSKKLECNLTVIKMENWKRWMQWEDTGLQWFPTSPHIQSVDAIRGSAVLGIWGELSLFSIGIGTTMPFQYCGAPGFNSDEITGELNNMNLYGVNLYPTKYRPFYGMYNNKDCNGILLKFSPSNLFMPYRFGIRLVLTIRKFHPDYFKKSYSNQSQSMFIKATGTEGILKGLLENKNDDEIISLAENGLESFIALRKKYLLYD